jgi:hypothetical protein
MPNIQIKRGLASALSATNPILASGEPIFETDTLKLKIGDGVTAYNSLGVVGSGSFLLLSGGTLTGSISSPSGNFTQSLQVNGTGVSLSGHTHTASQISDSTTAGRALLTGADAAAQRTSLGLGTLATQSGTFSGTSSGTNTGDQTISISGDVTAAGSTGSLGATVTKINGTLLSGLATGLLKNTTSTGIPSIAVAGTDYVANIVAGTNITVSGNAGTYTINSTGGSVSTNVTNSSNLYLWASFR